MVETSRNVALTLTQVYFLSSHRPELHCVHALYLCSCLLLLYTVKTNTNIGLTFPKRVYRLDDASSSSQYITTIH